MKKKWEKLPNGKWKLIKEIKKKTKDGYQWDDPRYQSLAKQAMKSVFKKCEQCGVAYSLADPCIHHLPDGYQNDMRRKEHKRKIKSGAIVEKTDDQQSLY